MYERHWKKYWEYMRRMWKWDRIRDFNGWEIATSKVNDYVNICNYKKKFIENSK